MPLSLKGRRLLAKLQKEYGKEKGTSVFYAMENKGTLPRGIVGARKKRRVR